MAFNDLLLTWGVKLKAKSWVSEVDRVQLEAVSSGLFITLGCISQLSVVLFKKYTVPCPVLNLLNESLTAGPTCVCSWKAPPGHPEAQLTSGWYWITGRLASLGKSKAPWGWGSLSEALPWKLRLKFLIPVTGVDKWSKPWDHQSSQGHF